MTPRRTLGSRAYRRLSPRARSFLANRAEFERNRDSWLASSTGQWVRIRDGVVEGLFATRNDAGFDFTSTTVSVFEIASQQAEQDRWSETKASTGSLLCEPFLDTDVPDQVFRADRTLELRGYSSSMIALLRLLALTGVWWNVIWWEEYDLDETDIMIGWSFNLKLMCVPVSMAFLFLVGWKEAVLCAAVVLASALGLMTTARNRAARWRAKNSA